METRERSNRIFPLIRIAASQEQIARMLSVSVRTVREWTNRPNDPLPTIPVGSEKRYPVREALRWVTRQTKREAK